MLHKQFRKNAKDDEIRWHCKTQWKNQKRRCSCRWHWNTKEMISYGRYSESKQRYYYWVCNKLTKIKSFKNKETSPFKGDETKKNIMGEATGLEKKFQSTKKRINQQTTVAKDKWWNLCIIEKTNCKSKRKLKRLINISQIKALQRCSSQTQ